MIHLVNLIKLYVTHGAEGFYFVMHQACMDPWSDFEMAYYKFMPLDQIMMYSYIMIDVVSNFYLCYFMRYKGSKKPLLTYHILFQYS